MKANKYQSLDDFLINDRNTFSLFYGRTFRKGPIFRGIAALSIGLIFFYLFILTLLDSPDANSFLFLLFSLIGIGGGSVILFAYDGVEIDIKRNELMEFTWFLKKFGKWQSISRYPFITIIKQHKNISYNSYIGATLRATTISYGRTEENEEYEICLVDKNHYKRITVYAHKDKNKIEEVLNLLIKKLEIPYTKFNPVQISKAKPGRRR